MFGLGRKKVVVEEVLPPAYSSAALRYLHELAAPMKNYVPSAADQGPVVFVALTSALLLYIAFLLLRAPRKSQAAAIVEKEVAKELVATEEEIPEEVVTEEKVAEDE